MDIHKRQALKIGDFTITRGSMLSKPVIYPRVSEDAHDRCAVGLWKILFLDEKGKLKKRYSLVFKRGAPPPWWRRRHQRACNSIFSDFAQQLVSAERAVGGHFLETKTEGAHR